MPFDAATTFISEYLDKRQQAIQKCERLKWSTDGQSTLKAMIDEKFERKKENDAWVRMKRSSNEANINIMMGVRLQIGWLAGSNRDLRTQFGAGTDCHQRVPLDHMRYNSLVLRWAKKGITRFRELIMKRVGGPIP